MLLAGDVNADDVRQFGTILASIHQGASSQRSVMQAIFAERGFFESLRVEPYYQYSASQVPQSADFLHELIADTHANIHTLVHGDYSPKNILVYQHRLILLDHEVIHWGDPAFDLGFSLTHLLSKAHHLSSARHAFLSAAALYWKSYIKGLDDVAWRDGIERRAVRHTLGCLLARVDGRSPLEYLSDAERVAQRRAVLKLMSTPPKQITELIGAFAEAIIR